MRKLLLGKRAQFTTVTIIIFSILMLNFPGTPSRAVSWANKGPDLEWTDYREPFVQSVRVQQDRRHPVEKATVVVELPDEFLINRTAVTLLISMSSNTRSQDSGKSDFLTFTPFLKVNDAFFSTYYIKSKLVKYHFLAEVSIKTKHLKPGKNQLVFSYAWRHSEGFCTGHGCGYTIQTMRFKEVPTIDYYLNLTSIPESADVYLDSTPQGQTPQKIKLSRGPHHIKIVKDGYVSYDENINVEKAENSMQVTLTKHETNSPEIEIFNQFSNDVIQFSEASEAIIEGRLFDENGIKWLIINKRLVKVENSTGQFRHTLRLNKSDKFIKIKASDELGNVSEKQLPVRYQTD